MTPRLYIVPYDSGHKGLRMGAGPFRLQRELGWAAEEIGADSEFTTEIGTAFQLYRNLATRIAADHDFPVVLSGNCGAAIGAAAGVGMDDLAVIWFDAHGDFNTPETSASGYLDGMALSILTGRCFPAIANTIPGFVPLPFERAIFAGGHDLDPSEVRDFAACGVHCDPLAALTRVKASRMLVHIDLDVLDVVHGRANHYAKPGGMSPDDSTSTVLAPSSPASRSASTGTPVASPSPRRPRKYGTWTRTVCISRAGS